VPVPPGVPLKLLSFCDQPFPEFKVKDAPAALPVICPFPLYPVNTIPAETVTESNTYFSEVGIVKDLDPTLFSLL
jgi:hypothetical protein